jgi:hypothetical protein
VSTFAVRVVPARPLNHRSQVVVYLLLLAAQVVGSMFVMWNELPAFKQLLTNPGKQLLYEPQEYFQVTGSFFVMQAAYWYRLWRVPIPFQGLNIILNHLLLFLGRLSFIFGGALFSVIFFRHLPELGSNFDIWLMALNGLMFGGTLFALFCLALELERLGHALGGENRN